MTERAEEKNAGKEKAEEKEKGYMDAEKREASKEGVSQEQESGARQRSGSAFEGIYDRMPDISIQALDRFILLCVIALVAVILAGVLKANHVF